MRPQQRTPLPLEEALRRYCERRGLLLGVVNREVVNRGKYVRQVSGRSSTFAGALVTFGRGQSFWMVRAWTPDAPGADDRLYDLVTRAIRRRAKELGWV